MKITAQHPDSIEVIFIHHKFESESDTNQRLKHRKRYQSYYTTPISMITL